MDDIFASARTGNLEAIRAAVDKSPEVLTQPGPGGWPAIHLAAHFGQADALDLLLDLGAPIELRSHNGNENTPLHAAVAGKRLNTVDLLLKRGADITARYGSGGPADAPGTRVLHEAAYHGEVAMIRLLLQWKADPTVVNPAGETPLMIAVKNKHDVAAEILQSAEREHRNLHDVAATRV